MTNQPSIWELETFYRKRDIIIIGAGFTGLWTAISIKEKFPNKNILIVERNTITTGASSRNAGFACFGSFTEIISDVKKMGWEKTLKLVKMRFDGLQKIQKYFNKSIDFELCGGYEIINDKLDISLLTEVNSKLELITNSNETFTIVNDRIKNFGLANSQNLIYNPFEGSLHSGKLLQELSKKCHQLEIDFLYNVDINDVIENKDLVVLKSNLNHNLEADYVINCTNAFSSNLLKTEDIIPARGQVLLTKPIKDLKLKGTFHYDEGFYYFRNLGDKILLGGGRNTDIQTEETYSFETTEKIQNRLEEFLRTVILPNQNYEIEMRWSGIMAMGKEKTPIVKKISDRQICAVRLSGMGVALAPIIGEKVSHLID